jgi:hypothetical protein
MDGDEGGTAHWLIDAAAATAAGCAVGWSLVLLGSVPAGACGGPAALLLAFALLRKVPAGGRRFRLPKFHAPDWAEVLPCPAHDPSGKVVWLRPPAARDTRPGPLAATRCGADVVRLAPDASAALKAALAQAKRAGR